MTTPQAPAKRHHQKIRRTKKLAEWRAKHPAPAKKQESRKTGAK
ncbi:MAG TPA: hypothetical protein VLM85_05480 [Polyangiaceae bacterium]|nr:hypothetical protein [Polyangiaceae bacterium]